MNKLDEVKSAALKLFANKGYAATSMQEIANEVGLNKASLYFYTKSKKELYLSIVEEQLSFVTESIREIFETFSDEPLEDLLFQSFKAIVYKPGIEWLLLWKRLNLKLVSDLDDDLMQTLKKILSHNNENIRKIANDYISTKRFEVSEDVVLTFIVAYETFIEGLFDWRLMNKQIDMNQVLHSIWSAFWNGSRSIFTQANKPSTMEGQKQ